MRIGLLGTGHVAKALAAGWNRAGHDIVLGSRRPEDTELHGELKELLDAGVRVGDPSAAAAHAEVLVNATPGAASVPLLQSIGASALEGKILLDIAVGYQVDDTLTHPVVSLGEELQRTFPRTPVVKTLCTVDSVLMTAPGSLEGPSTIFLSGDDTDAKRTVSGLLLDLGWPRESQLDLGGIVTARGQEHFALLFVGIAKAINSFGFGIRVVPPAAA
ncbi:NADPH-dependent F420 reductase [Streptomyces sp. NPDC054975]